MEIFMLAVAIGIPALPKEVVVKLMMSAHVEPSVLMGIFLLALRTNVRSKTQ